LYKGIRKNRSVRRPPVSEEFAKLSDLELLSLIKRGEEELERRKGALKERLKAEIEEKLNNAGLEFGDLFPEADGKARKAKGPSGDAERRAVKPRYRDPVFQETWSGRRPRPPHWVQRIMAERRWTLEEFKQSGEFDA
jgi:DNA-binding protein H-NS